MISIPLGLRHVLESGQCVLFIGAGIGGHFLKPDKSTAPTSGYALAEEMAKFFSIDTGGNYDLAAVSQVVDIKEGRKELDTFVRSKLSDLEPDETFKWLSTIRWKAIYTTNYDYCIERAYELNPNPHQNIVPFSMTSELRNCDTRFEVPLYYLHGTLFGASSPKIIITEDDYTVYKEHRRSLFEILKVELATSCILYIGYSNRDPNWRNLINEMESEFYPSRLPQSYRITLDDDPMQQIILKAKNIETIVCSLSDFVDAASTALSSVTIDPDNLRRIKETVPSDFADEFDKSPAAVARLIFSWDYVNQVQFHETPNVHDFLRGDRPNWGLIGSNQHFERDIEGEIYNELIDYATSRSNKAKIVTVLGPAGYGVTTLLMSLAARLIKDKAGSVYMLKPGSDLLEGDVDFASSILKDHPFFFVDNGADHGRKIHSIIHHLKDIDRPALFVVGERLNEWRQEHGTLRGKEFDIEPLSDQEINKLLDCLASHSELHDLEHLNRDVQFSVIQKLHNKELLVAMREATEGKSFDAILESEFNGIKDYFSKQVYLYVCCFYQHRAYLRDALLADLMGVPLNDLLSRTRDTTDGVVIYDCLNPSKGNFGARSRHRTIAAIVWERCSSQMEKDSILHKALSSLNLNYSNDKTAFEEFYRSDRLIDSIATFEGKSRFFDMACKKDPDSPYVRQHYARMLSREKKPELALSLIDQALKMRSDIRVLYHTKGKILSRMALDPDNSHEIALRMMVKSEDAFHHCLRMAEKDDYAYVGLAELYLGWARRLPTNEAAAYISKSEDIINTGLRKVRVRDALWIQSSYIKKFIEDEPAYLKELERAVKDNPSSIIARYLLGRAYRKAKRYPEAISVLDYIITNHHDEFRSFVEYSLSMVYSGRLYKDASAILRISSLYGFSDPRYIATLGGMLFLDGKFTDADDAFSESSKRNFTPRELNSLQFYPPDPSNLDEKLRIKGKVVDVGPGLAFIDSGSYPRIICPGSKYRGIIMKKGLELSFLLAFSAKGPIADKPEVIK